MTYWFECDDEQKDAWHWLGVSISLADLTGLHSDPPSDMDPATMRHRKRVWWSMYMRDRIIALGMRRQMRLHDESYRVPMLEVADFDISALAAQAKSTCWPSWQFLRNVDAQEDLARLCVEKARLCVLVGRILRERYTIAPSGEFDHANTAGATMRLFLREKPDSGKLTILARELDAWLASLPNSCRPDALNSRGMGDGGNNVVVQGMLLHLVHAAVIIALHRPHSITDAMQDDCTPDQAGKPGMQRTHDASMQIADIVDKLYQLGLDRYLLATAVGVLLPAMIIQLVERKHAFTETNFLAWQSFQQCRRVLERLRECYASADRAAEMVDAAARRLDLHAFARSPHEASDYALGGEVGDMHTLSNPSLMGSMDLGLNMVGVGMETTIGGNMTASDPRFTVTPFPDKYSLPHEKSAGSFIGSFQSAGTSSGADEVIENVPTIDLRLVGGMQVDSLLRDTLDVDEWEQYLTL